MKLDIAGIWKNDWLRLVFNLSKSSKGEGLYKQYSL